MAGHTPGPWAFDWEDEDRKWAIVTSPTGKIVANVNTESGPDLPPLVSDKMPAGANARLIACAPSMLTALKEALHPLEMYHIYGWPDRNNVIAQVKSAIAKAEGRE